MAMSDTYSIYCDVLRYTMIVGLSLWINVHITIIYFEYIYVLHVTFSIMFNVFRFWCDCNTPKTSITRVFYVKKRIQQIFKKSVQFQANFENCLTENYFEAGLPRKQTSTLSCTLAASLG